jgi:hypothetical protein
MTGAISSATHDRTLGELEQVQCTAPPLIVGNPSFQSSLAVGTPPATSPDIAEH